MNLPKDQNDWHEGHLATAVKEMDNALARYERRYDAEHPEQTDHLFMDYMHKEERVVNVRIVVRGK